MRLGKRSPITDGGAPDPAGPDPAGPAVRAKSAARSRPPHRQPGKLAPGSRLPTVVVRASQRERLMIALIETVDSKGLPAATVADVIARAHVARAAFYDQFESLEECFLATYDAQVERVVEQVRAAYETGGLSWSERIEATMGALARAACDWPAAARVCLSDILAAGPAAHQRRDQPLVLVRQMLRQGSAGRRRAPAGLTPGGDRRDRRTAPLDLQASARGSRANQRGQPSCGAGARADGLAARVQPALAGQRQPGPVRNATRAPRAQTARAAGPAIATGPAIAGQPISSRRPTGRERTAEGSSQAGAARRTISPARLQGKPKAPTRASSRSSRPCSSSPRARGTER